MKEDEIIEEFELLQLDLVENPQDYNQEAMQNNINWLRVSLQAHRAQVLSEAAIVLAKFSKNEET